MARDMYVAADNIAIIGGWAQDAIDSVSDLHPGGPAAFTRADSIAYDLADEAGRAEDRAVEFLENQEAASTPGDLIDPNFWNPLPHGWGLAGRYSLFGAGDMLAKLDRGVKVKRWVNPRTRPGQHRRAPGQHRGAPGRHRWESGQHRWTRPQHRYDRLDRLSRDRPPQHRHGRHRLWVQETRTVGRLDRIPDRPYKWSRIGGRALGYAATAWLAWDTYNERSEWEEVNDPDISDGDRRARAAGAATFTAGGALVGAAAGAAIGTMLFPGVGTLAGAVIGLAFGMVGAYIGATIGDAFSQWGATTGQAVWDAIQWTGGAIGDAAAWTGNAVGEAADWTGDRLDDAGEALNDAADAVGDFASDAADVLTGWW